MIIPMPHSDEVYRCDHCEHSLQFLEINKTWQCPDCKEPASIKVEVNGNYQSCLRIQVRDIKKGETTTFDKKHLHNIIAISEISDGYGIALSQFGTRTFNGSDYILIIDGAWVTKAY